MQHEKNIWFPAKRYGYGWGVPIRWQGWLVLATYVLLFSIGMLALLEGEHRAYAVLYQFALTAALIGVCAWKGEPARWRWGGK